MENTHASRSRDPAVNYACFGEWTTEHMERFKALVEHEQQKTKIEVQDYLVILKGLASHYYILHCPDDPTYAHDVYVTFKKMNVTERLVPLRELMTHVPEVRGRDFTLATLHRRNKLEYWRRISSLDEVGKVYGILEACQYE